MLERHLARCSDVVYTLLRVLVGVLFALHGCQKLFGAQAADVAVGSQLWFGGVIELVTGIAIALGAFTAWAAFLASGTMAVAYVQFHWQLRLDENVLPMVNRGELALVYAVLFLFIACHGAGRHSIDHVRAVRRSSALLATPPLAP